MSISKQRLWTKDFILITLTSFFISVMYFLILTTITPYVIENFNAAESKAGLAASIYVIGILISRLIIGKYLEIIGRRKLFYIGVFLTFFATLLYFPVDNLNILIIIRFIHGAVMGIALAVMQTTVMDLIPDERRGEGISFYTLNFILGTAIGPFLGVLINQIANMQTIFIVCTIMTAISVVLSCFTSIPKGNITSEQLDEMKGFHFKDFFEGKALPIALLMGILALSYSGILTFLAAYSMEINLMTAASFFFIVYSVIVLLSRPVTGRVLDSRGDNIVMYPAFILFSAGLFFLSQAGHGLTLLIGGAFIGLGFGNLQSSLQAVAIKKTPSHRIGLAVSTFFICHDVGVGIGPFLLGYLIPVIGYRNMYFTLGIIVLFCAFLYYVIHGKKAAFNKPVSSEV
ncbi:MFS transporter [Neobacillus mesonae]|uniref:MFS transporter n=1 Tax=Neobacillus mesonae TaxID=1193713 RepID=UPI0020405422|nr:MFS transporter [Neobacillus mesonae]MCM3567515.1 MFS transporter [Neobacillus mesonae]